MEVDLARAPLDTSADERRLISVEIEVRRLAADHAAAFADYLETDWGRNWQIEALRALRRDPGVRSSRPAPRRDSRIRGPRRDGTGPIRAHGCAPGSTKARSWRHSPQKVPRRPPERWLLDRGHPMVGPIDFYARQVGATLTRCFWQMEKSLVPDAAR